MHDTNFYKKQLQKLKIHYKKGMYWAIPVKKNWGRGERGEVEDMEFPEVSKKEHVKFPGIN